MVTRNIIIFGEPSIDRRFLLKMLVTCDSNVLQPVRIFEAHVHSTFSTSKNQYRFYDTAGLDSDVSKLEPREALGNLYRFIRVFDGGINLLIYVVDDRHSVDNIKLFYDFLCRRDVPIILVTSNAHPPSASHSELDLPQFKHILTLNDPKREDEASLREAISEHIERDPKSIPLIERFEVTARGFWKLLERAAGWSISDYHDALKASLMDHETFSDRDVDAICESIVQSMKKLYSRNVIVFGDTGAGKTSVIKMLSNEVEVSAKASSAGGSTFESKAYDVDINEYHYVFHDTVGLDDGTSISLSPQEAIKALYQLLRKVEGGVSLLVYVHRGKIKPSQVENYKLFSHVICKSMVPTALVVTGLEEVDLMDEWWQANKGLYDELGISTKHHACITSTKGGFNPKYKEYVYQDLYGDSQRILKALFLDASLLNPWKIPNTPNWWKLLVVEVYNIFAVKLKWQPLVANQSLYCDLVGIGGMEENKAKDWANNMNRVLPIRRARHST